MLTRARTALAAPALAALALASAGPALAAPADITPVQAASSAEPVAPTVNVEAPDVTAPSTSIPVSKGEAWTVPAASVTAPATQVAAPALAEGDAMVRVVTTQVVGGKPVVSTTTVPATQAIAAVDTAQAQPGAIAVAVDTRVSVGAYNDPLRAQKWDLTAMGGETFHSRVNTGGVTVAVIDTGVDGGHPDLRGALVGGAEFVTGRGQGAGNGQVDPMGHGTHVAGIIAAVANNGIGTAGMAPGTRIMPVRTMGADGSGWSSDIARGITWAADHGAKVINLSLGGAKDTTVDKAVQYATAKGAVVVAAAGNERAEGNPVTYPAAYTNVIGVAATTRTSASASYSNTGDYVDISAPGSDIVSTYPRRLISTGYASMSGTSMATPAISATVAGLKAARPSLTTAQVQSILATTSTDLGAKGRDNTFGAGLVNPNKALCTVVVCPATFTWSTPSWYPTTGTLSRASVIVKTAAGAPIAKAPVRACYSVVGVATPSCVTRVSDAYGRVDMSFTARRITNVTASYAGGSTAKAAASTATFRTTFATRVSGGYRAMSATVAPRSATVNVDRWDARRRAWAYNRRVTTNAAGAVTVKGLAPGSYRIWVPGTSLLNAVASAGVVVR